MKDPILLNKLWKEVEAGNVIANQCGDLTLFKYTQDCHIHDRWNDVNRQARGIIFRTDGTVVARPFAKFFNMNEREETKPQHLPWSEGVEIYEKMDGSCGIGYMVAGPPPGEEAPVYADGFCAGYFPTWHLATPGSMESDQAKEGTRILNEGIQPDLPKLTQRSRYNLAALPQDCTPVFEIIYPGNRIVVDYHGKSFLSLLAIFEHNGTEWHPRRVDQIAELCGFHRPRRFDIDLEGDIPFEDNFEGYVAQFGNGLRVKVKSPTYLRIHRLLNHLSPKGVVDLIRGKEYRVTVEQLPDSIARDFDDIRAAVQTMYNDRLTYIHERLRALSEVWPYEVSRKTQAMWIKENVRNDSVGLVFGLLDGKDVEESIWKLVLEKVKSHEATSLPSNCSRLS